MAARVLVGLGSNRGASVDIVERALDELEAMSNAGFRASSLWRTTPVDCPPGSKDFINAVALLVVDSANPEELLRDLKAMERRYGRDRTPVKNAPRELDLDLLLFFNEGVNEGADEAADDGAYEVRESEALTLPHPRAIERRFVMVPAAEVAPQWVWPGTGRTIAQMARSLVTDEQLHRLRQ